MRALMIHDSLPRLAATRFLSALTPRAYVGRTSPLRLREIPDPALPAPDWAVARARLSGLCGSDYKQIFMNGRFDNPMTGLESQLDQPLDQGVVHRIRLQPADRSLRLHRFLEGHPEVVDLRASPTSEAGSRPLQVRSERRSPALLVFKGEPC